MFRKKAKKKYDRKVFAATSGTHKKNLVTNPMRGGYRL